MRVDETRVPQLARVFKALGDETRVRIVHLLARRGELCVCDVESALEISQSKASRHLRYLEQAGIVEDRRRGIWVYYRLARPASAVVDAAVRELRRELSTDPAALADLEASDRCSRPEGCSPIEAVPRSTRTGRRGA